MTRNSSNFFRFSRGGWLDMEIGFKLDLAPELIQQNRFRDVDALCLPVDRTNHIRWSRRRTCHHYNFTVSIRRLSLLDTPGIYRLFPGTCPHCQHYHFLSGAYGSSSMSYLRPKREVTRREPVCCIPGILVIQQCAIRCRTRSLLTNSP